MAAVGAVLGTLRLGGLASVEGVRVAGDLVAAAVVTGVDLGAGSAVLALVVLAVRHNLAGEGTVRVQGRGGPSTRTVVQVVRILAESVVAAIVTYYTGIRIYRIG